MNLYGYRVEEMPASIHTLYLDPDQIRAERQLRFVLFALMPRPLVVENNHHHNCRQMLTTPLFPPAVGTVCEVVLEPFLQAVLQHLPVDPIDVKALIWSGRSTSGGPFGHSRRPAGTGPGVPFVLVELRELDGLRVLGGGDYHLVAMAADQEAAEPLDVFALGDALGKRQWYLDRQGPPDSLHATVSNGNAAVIDQFLADLRTSVDEVRGHTTDDRDTTYSAIE